MDDEEEDENWVFEHLGHRFELLREREQLGDDAFNWLKFEHLADWYKHLRYEYHECAPIRYEGEDDWVKFALMKGLKHEMEDVRRKAYIQENAQIRSAITRIEQNERKSQRIKEEESVLKRRNLVYMNTKAKSAQE